MLKKLLFTLSVTLSLCLASFAQQVQVTGTVKDNAGNPVAGATILVEGTTNGTTSNADGSYSISAASDATLLVSFIGYQSQKLAIAGKTRIDIVLKEDSQAIDDVIVVAFGTAKKEAFTGSAAVIKSDDIVKSQQSNVAQALAGKVAGVQLTNTSGQPGQSPDIRIRGFSSLNAGNGPLWIVDGMPYSGDLNNLNPNDIESMTVLKDAASNALYGARGANGVVMITTKKAKSKEAVISFDAKWGVNSRAVKDYEYITNPAQFYEVHYGALKRYYLDSGYSEIQAHSLANQNLTASANDGGLGYMVYTLPEGQEFIGINGKVNPQATLGRRVVYEGEEYYIQPDNWTDAAFRHSLRQEYNISISGSGEKTSVYASAGYLDNQGIAYNSDMQRFTSRLKVDYQAKKWLKMGANINYSRFNYDQIDDGGASNSSGNVFAYTTTVGPIYPLYIRDGNGNIRYTEDGIMMYDYGRNAGMERSIFTDSNALSDSRLDTSNAEGNAFNGTTYFDITFLKDFKFTFNAGVTLDETRSTSIMNPYFGQYKGEKGLIGKGHSRQFEYNTQQILNYTKQFGAHNLNVMVGHEYYNARSYSLSASKSHMLTQENDELSGAVIDKQSAGSSRSEYNNEGYFARVMYDYSSKYFFSASFRRDASSRFHPDHRWGNFWSLGGAWILSREDFMAGTQEWLDNLKVKASIGSQGNDNIGNFQYTNTYTIENANGEVSTVFNSKGSENITWETNSNFNAGVEFSFLRGMVTGGVEYFLRKTTDMLLSFPVPPSQGYSSYYANVGDMRNSGIEIELNYTPIRTDKIVWDINLNMTHLRNKITMLPQERRNKVVEGYGGYVSGTTFFGEGLPMYTFYMKKYAGISSEGESMWYMDETDANGNVIGRTTTTEYAKASDYLCGDPIPDLYGGFGTSLSCYGFDLSVAFTYQIGGLAYDSGYAAAMYSPANKSTGMNWHKDILNAWTPENSSSNIPRLQYEDQNQNGQSDRFLMNASYLNLQNINLGYTLPAKLSQKLGIDRIRIYLACENVYYWSKRQGFDPRYSYSGSTSQATYSPVRTISGGINLQF
ncbi:SusC/RagA family protein [Alistipes sp. An116]|uniref:SusC/RagA family TonB-linked outer membrane protein n=1 Tax=Alistipes sp. An116 TaxID=1965546 RepID=UPI000B36F6B8|nr:TonB-dependent receptor [Alistipes sp. An116]OUQ50881.1 SusC/RagA family protein [Alistipes sp. An116]